MVRNYCGFGAVLGLGFAAVRGAPSVPQRTYTIVP
jgi:hypothetical protein